MKLIAIDMDGTLLSSDKKISAENKLALQEAIDAGHQVMICTGRHHDSLLTFLKDENLSFPISASNGAFTQTDEKIIHETSMEYATAARLFEWLQSHRYPFKFYTNRGAFSERDFLQLAKEANQKVPVQEGEHWEWEVFLDHQRKSNLTPISSFNQVEKGNIRIYKFFVYTPEIEKKSALKDWLQELGGTHFTSSMDDNVEIMGVDGHKGTGITQMAQHFGIPLSDTIAIGDNHNDIPMLKTAGTAIAMGNAEPEVKALCDYTTKSNDEGGVAFAIREFVLK
ncbi:MAG: Cof-type HAD-IIB family hydrolase [Turicibacter sp.]|nr:Cof-type HAD-IIB family hydrolase [Turicibacter sp.]